MKAAVYDRYGEPEVLHLREMEKPSPKSGQVLVRVRATSVNYGDLLARNLGAVSPGKFNMPLLFWLMSRFYFGLFRPRIAVLGNEFAGEVEAVGAGVTRFQPGDPVFGFLSQGMGAYAEYLCVPETGCVAAKPARLSHPEAAVVPYGAVMALGLLRKANLRPGQKALILGASGGIGSAAVQIARHLGAEVTGVASAPKLEWVRSLGANRVIDYGREDFTRDGERYDLILDVLGRSSFARCRGSLTSRGIYLSASFKAGKLLRMLATSFGRGPRAVCAIAPGGVDDLLAARELVEAGAIRLAVDRSFPLARAAEAHRYLEEGLARGKVAILVGDEAPPSGEVRP